MTENKEEKIKAWMCSHCGKYSRTEDEALRCCTAVYEVEIEEFELK